MKKGFTLVEILLGSVLVAIVLSALSVFFVDFLQTQEKFDVLEGLRRNAAAVFERVTRELEAADSIDLSKSKFDASPGKLTYRNNSAWFTLERATGSNLAITPAIGSQEILTDEEAVIDNFVIKNLSSEKRPGVILLQITFVPRIPAYKAVLSRKFILEKTITFKNPIILPAPSRFFFEGCNTTLTDGDSQVCRWELSPISQIFSSLFILNGNGKKLAESAEPFGEVFFDDVGLGSFTCDLQVKYKDATYRSERLNCIVMDDDMEYPQINLAGSSGTMLESENQWFGWSIADPSGIKSADIKIYKNDVIIHQSAAASGSFDLNSFGKGKFKIEAKAQDADNDRLFDSLTNLTARYLTVY